MLAGVLVILSNICKWNVVCRDYLIYRNGPQQEMSLATHVNLLKFTV